MATFEQLARLADAETYAALVRHRVEHPIVHLPGGGIGVVEERSENGSATIRAHSDGRLIVLPWWLLRPVDDRDDR
ncbi:hypothetical protein ACPA54_15165 [Uniformispora flossi]|uniref:hypothetical protein n=1 Tax=Uniformispora flossi TaxID=3390723 RepID=UPI003C2E21A8